VAQSSDPSCQAQPHLYVRLNSGAANASTLDLGPVIGSGQGFKEATPDGSEVVFNSTSGLTVYDTTTRTATLITGSTSVEQVSISSDGSTIYFNSSDQLAGAPPLAPGLERYIYRYDVVGHTLSYVDQETGTGALFATSPDGRYLIFAAENAGLSTHSGSQFFRYDSATGSLLCVSCEADGYVTPADSGVTNPFPPVEGTFSQDPNAMNLMSSDGRRVFFATTDSLAPRDVNPETRLVGTGPIEITDIYEWEAEGTVNCTDPNGCLHLLNAGTSSVQSFLIGATPDGSNVFIGTHDQLVPSDTDQLGDMYDLRIGGGFPGPTQPVDCAGACQGAYAAPAPPTAASVSFFGPENATPGSAPARSAKPRVLTRTVRGSTFLVRVTVPGPGAITIAGAGIKAVHSSVSRAGTYRLRVTLTAHDRQLLARRHQVGLNLRVSYAPPGAGAQSAVVRLPVNPAVRQRTTHARRATTTTGRAGR
jgi:hypothetical protein